MSARLSRICSSLVGISSSSDTMRSYSASSRVPRASAQYRPMRYTTASWVEKALVVATAISGPAQV